MKGCAVELKVSDLWACDTVKGRRRMTSPRI